MSTGTQTEVVMPQMGVSVSEGTITKWLKQVGETINADESLLEISTDKVDTEVPSPATGVLAEILVQEGETVEVGTKLAVIAPEGAEAAPTPAPSDGGGDGDVPEPATAQAAAEVAAVSDTPATPPTAESVDEALCFGWIDGQKGKLDDAFWLQKFTPRGSRSMWSRITRLCAFP